MTNMSIAYTTSSHSRRRSEDAGGCLGRRDSDMTDTPLTPAFPRELGFYETAKDKILQELVSDASPSTILVDLDELVATHGASNQGCLRVVVECLLRYVEIKANCSGTRNAKPFDAVEKILSKYWKLISASVDTPDDEIHLLESLELACASPPTRIQLHRIVVMGLYRHDIIQPEAVILWSTKEGPDTVKEIREQAESFVSWLKDNLEAESDGGDDILDPSSEATGDEEEEDDGEEDEEDDEDEDEDANVSDECGSLECVNIEFEYVPARKAASFDVGKDDDDENDDEDEDDEDDGDDGDDDVDDEDVEQFPSSSLLTPKPSTGCLSAEVSQNFPRVSALLMTLRRDP
ncbi:hypothetical protein BC829DRAFT_46136 [Chytridium lagenaria]|nr:hypothetical protein BC829DRAFT_46136 [Chytridium lagenaria]